LPTSRVSFVDDDLGYFDREACRLEPIENPFGPKLLPTYVSEINRNPSVRTGLDIYGAPRPTKMGTIASPRRYDEAAYHAIDTPILQCFAISYCASRQSPERPSPPAWTLLASVLSLAAAV
jgi:hypothetical protein